MEIAVAAAFGLVLGAITGMPLGVVNVAIVDAALAREPRHALGLGIGGAIADAVHALLAFVGVAQVVTARPAWSRAFAIAAAVIIVAYAVLAWRHRRAVPAKRVAQTSLPRAIASGMLLTLPNPGALAAWVAVAAMTYPAASHSIAIAIAGGVGLGSAAWFTLLGRLVARVDPDHRALRFVPRVALVVFVAIAIIGVVRVTR